MEKRTKIHHGLAEGILEADHHGLEKVKERILEYLAVQQRARKLKGPILCLVGPPGVGKTSLGAPLPAPPIASLCGCHLGGVRDEAEIRGHRRTYIGSMPGKIVQNLAKVGVRNPLFCSTKSTRCRWTSRGDPSSALLEVLDPEQNNTFNDHYLEVDFDLSDVMFVATANSLNIPPPLLDRMEVIRIPGYTEDEAQYRGPLSGCQTGYQQRFAKEELEIVEDALLDIIRFYTREAGVRNLEREIAKICRVVRKSPETSRGQDRGHARHAGQVFGRAPVPLWFGRGAGSGRPGDRISLDRGRRGTTQYRGGSGAGQGQS